MIPDFFCWFWEAGVYLVTRKWRCILWHRQRDWEPITRPNPYGNAISTDYARCQKCGRVKYVYGY